MKGYNLWSHRPYRPLLFDVGDIYVCRIAPGKESVHFEWLNDDGENCRIFLRKRGEGEFVQAGETCGCEFDISDIADHTDFEFYVEASNKKSRVRLFRTGEAIGTVVNYLHPDDECYSFSGKYLCSPSYVRHPDGFLLASMDLFAGGYPQNLSLIFRSDDEGKTWHYVSELTPCFWGKLFIHKGEIYMLSCSTEYGDLLIGKSSDGGKTFTAPVVLLKGMNGKNGSSGVHKNPQNIMYFGGRIYNTLEFGAWANKEYGHAAMVMSCDENDDLLVPENWSFSYPLKFDRFAPELSDLPDATMTIEGTLVVDTKGELLNIMRFGKFHNAIVYEVNTSDYDAPLSYQRLMEFPANYSKFMIKYDEISKRYFSVGTMAYNRENTRTRNLLSLLSSKDLEKWEVVCDLHDFRHENPNEVGFQYVDFEIEGDDLVYLCRTALNNAHNYHDANYSTFHRIEKFRDLL